MGLFSWITSDTNESIAVDRTKDIYMTGSDGRVFHQVEPYEGYGMFGGKDFFEYLAELNGATLKEGQTLRDRGLDLYYGRKSVEIPRLVALKSSLKGDVLRFNAPEECPYQGYFYTDSEERL